MAKFLRGSRVEDAVRRLADWRGKVISQTSSHLFAYLALLRKGVTRTGFHRFEESDDYDFFNTYFRVGSDDKKPYFDPLTRRMRIATHPHSNVSTARKGTFEKNWRAAESKVENGATLWKLSDNSADIVAKQVMTKAAKTTRINVVDLAVWLFRTREFADDASAETLRALLRAEFPMPDADFNTLFEYQSEPSDRLFLPSGQAPDAYDALIQKLDVGDDTPAVKSMLAKFQVKTDKSQLEDDDAILAEVQQLLRMGTSGVVLRGPPGTGKSWYAENVALSLTKNDRSKVFRIQFHPSFGYEDFFEGYVADENTRSGFRMADKVFLVATAAARATQDLVVLVIDEINRGDTARILGEALTYLEQGWRDVPFTSRLSGKSVEVPPNLLVIGTMNPHDRSITQLDMALLRRLDHIDVPPDKQAAARFLTSAGMGPQTAEHVVTWFEDLQKLLPFGIGHTYFRNVGDVGALAMIWRYRILPFCESILESEHDKLTNVKASYDALERRLRGQ